MEPPDAVNRNRFGATGIIDDHGSEDALPPFCRGRLLVFRFSI